MVWNKGQ